MLTQQEEMKIIEEIRENTIKKCRLLYGYEIKEILDKFVINDAEKWLKPCYYCKFRPDKVGNDFTCADCYKYNAFERGENDG